MLKIVHRFILQELLEYFLLALFLFTFVLFLNKIFHLTELIINKGVPLRTVAHLLALITPSFLIITIPLALLVACIMVFSRLSSDSEIVALRASGVSFYNLLLPVFLLSLASWAFSSSLMLYALAWSHRGLESMKYELIRSQAAGFEVKERVFNDSFDGLVLYVNEIPRGDSRMKGILISDRRSEGEPRVIFAREGFLVPDPGSLRIVLRLRDGTVHTLQKEEGKYQLVSFKNYDLSLDAQGTLMGEQALGRGLKQLPIQSIRARLASMDKGDRNYYPLLVEFHKRFALPFACLILGFLGAPLGVQSRRSGKAGGFALSLGAIFIYYILITVGEGLGEEGKLPPGLAMWLPNALLGALGLWAVLHVGRGRLIEMPAPLEGLKQRLAARYRGLSRSRRAEPL